MTDLRVRGVGIALVLTGVAIAAVPQFTKCMSHMMACSATARMELFVGTGIAVAGIAAMLASRQIARFLAGGAGMLLSCAAISLPLWLTGTCGNQMMRCNTLLKPSIMVLGVAALALSLGLTVLLSRAPEHATEYAR